MSCPIVLFITHVEADGPLLKIWGQVDRLAARNIERMLQQYSSDFQFGSGIPLLSSLHCGLLCCTRYEGDGKYYRAKILNLDNVHKGDVFVKFIDFGNTETVNVGNIRLLNVEQSSLMNTIPPQALEYYLVGIIPTLGTWKSDELSFIKQQLHYGEFNGVVVGNICYKRLLVLLYKGTDFAKFLIEKNLGISIDYRAQLTLVEGLFGPRSSSIPASAMPQSTHVEGTHTKVRESGGQLLHNRMVNGMLNVPVLDFNSEHEVKISHIEDGPYTFSVQLVSRDNSFKMLTKILNESTPHPLSGPVSPGSVCVARCSRNNFLSRAVVTSVHEFECKLYFVDTGCSKVVPYSYIYELPQTCMTQKCFALNFTLSGIQEFSETEEIESIFSELVKGQSLTLHVVPPEGPPIKQYGKLFLNGTSILLMLAQKLENHQRIHVFPTLPFPAIGEEVLVTVSYVASVSNFFVHLRKNSEQLDEIMNCTQAHCHGNALGIITNKISSGTPVCALYSSDQQWYRAKVMSVAGDSASVLYVDYGNAAILPLSSLKQMSENLMTVSAQAVACCLKGFETLENSERVSVELEEKTADKILRMNVVDHLGNGMLLVELIDISVKPFRNIGTEILAATTSSPVDTAEEDLDWDIVEKPNDCSPKPGSVRKSGETEQETKPSRDLRREPNDRWKGVRRNEELGYSSEKIRSEENWEPREQSKKWNAISNSRDNERNNGPRNKDSSRYEKGGPDYSKRNAGLNERNWSGHSKNDGNPRKFMHQNYGDNRKYTGNDRQHGAQDERLDNRSDKHHSAVGETFDIYRKSTNEGKRGRGKGWSGAEARRHRGGKSTTESNRNEFKPRSTNEFGTKKFKSRSFQPLNNTRRNKPKQFIGASAVGYSKERVRTPASDIQIFQDAVIPLKSSTNVELVFAASPSDFVVQISDNSGQLEDIMAKIAARYNEMTEPILPMSSFRVGSPCIARYSDDNTWYRAEIEELGDSPLVCFVDYGNKDTVAPSDVKTISEDLLTIPILGIRCSLIGAKPNGSEWTSEDITLFMDLTDGKPLKALFIHKIGKFVEVILRGLDENNIDDDVSINEQFGANSLTDVLSKIEIPSFATEADHFTELTPHPDMREQVEVSWFINPEEFFIQIKSPNLLALFKDMMINLQASNIDKTPLKHSVPVGTPVIAKYSNDGVFYRAVVKENNLQGNCLVQYVDYGNHDIVEYFNLWSLEMKFMNIPKQAILCSLTDVKPADSVWPKKCTEYENIFGAEVLECVFHGESEGDKNLVSLYKDGVSLATELVTCGLAVEDNPNLVTCGLAVEDEPSADHLWETEPVNLELLKGQQLAAHVSFIQSVSEFYVQLEPECVAQLQANLLLLEEKEPVRVDDLDNFSDVCLVMNDETQLFRGKIVKCTDTNSLLVDLVDFGTKCTVDLSNVWMLPPELTTVPFQATKCSVTGSAEGNTPPDLEEHFKMEVEDQDVIMLVDEILNNGRLSVRLFDVEGQRLELLKNIDNSAAMEVNPLCPHPILRSSIQIWVAHVGGPYAVWLQRVRDADLVAKLLQDLYTFYETEDRGKSFYVIEENKLCAAKSVNDGGWYRAFIELRTTDGISVCFTDYGNSEVIPEENIKELDSSFYSPHCLAFKTSLPILAEDETMCREFLTDVVNEKELSVTLDRTVTGKWLLDADGSLNLCKGLIDANLALPIEHKVLTGNISLSSLMKECASDKIEVLIPFSDSPEKFWIQDKNYVEYIYGISYRLMEAKDFPSVNFPQKDMTCVAFSPETEEWYRARILNISEEEAFPYEVQYIDYGNNEFVDSIRAFPEDLCKIPALAEQCSLLLPQGVAAWPGSSKRQLAELSGGGDVTFTMEIKERGEPLIVSLYLDGEDVGQQLLEHDLSQEIYAEPKLSSDDKSVVVTHVNSAADFWVQDCSSFNELVEITEKLSLAEKFQPLPENFTGELCAASCGEDERWYRARVLSYRKNNSDIHCIDYGNCSSTSDLRSLTSELLQIPPLAKQCSLPLPEGWSKWPTLAEEKFTELIGDDRKVFKLCVIEENEPCIVSLIHEGVKVEDFLIETCRETEHAIGTNDGSNRTSEDVENPPIKGDIIGTGRVSPCGTLENNIVIEKDTSNNMNVFVKTGDSMPENEEENTMEKLPVTVKELPLSSQIKTLSSDNVEVISLKEPENAMGVIDGSKITSEGVSNSPTKEGNNSTERVSSCGTIGNNTVIEKDTSNSTNVLVNSDSMPENVEGNTMEGLPFTDNELPLSSQIKKLSSDNVELVIPLKEPEHAIGVIDGSNITSKGVTNSPTKECNNNTGWVSSCGTHENNTIIKKDTSNSVNVLVNTGGSMPENVEENTMEELPITVIEPPLSSQIKTLSSDNVEVTPFRETEHAIGVNDGSSITSEGVTNPATTGGNNGPEGSSPTLNCDEKFNDKGGKSSEEQEMDVQVSPNVLTYVQDLDEASHMSSSNDLNGKTGEDLDGLSVQSIKTAISKKAGSMELSERETTFQESAFKLEHSETLIQDLHVEMKTPESKCGVEEKSLVNGAVSPATVLASKSSDADEKIPL